MQLEMYDKVQIKALLLQGDDTYTICGKSYDRENNLMFELEDEDGYLLDDLYYPESLIKVIEEN